MSSLLGAHTWPTFDGNQSSLPFQKCFQRLCLHSCARVPVLSGASPRRGVSDAAGASNSIQYSNKKNNYQNLRDLKSKYTLLCFNRKFIRAAYVHDSCLGKFVESKTHKVANRLRKIKWNKRPMKRKSTTYITSWVLPGDTTDVHLLFTIWHCKIFWVVLTGRLLSSNKACESACLWRVFYAFRDD